MKAYLAMAVANFIEILVICQSYEIGFGVSD